MLLSLAGFLVKVKKILECICVNCGKLKSDIVGLRFPLVTPRISIVLIDFYLL
jgi:hypothetical protein